MNTFIGLMIPFIGTTLGSAMVFFMKDKMSVIVEKILLGFAGGVMIAASIWSLLNPAMEMSASMGKLKVVPAALGFLLGVALLLVLDQFIPHIHVTTGEKEGLKSKLKKTTMMVFAITLHNFPEGMAVGVVFAGLSSSSNITLMGAFALSIGIAIQNFPEGAIVSMPLVSEGASKKKAFFLGALSGLVEPLGAMLTIMLASTLVPILPYLLSFAAGAMVYVVIEELIPEANTGKHSNIATIGFALGFALMMVLDVVLG